MPINITALGGAGTHTLKKTNVNLEEDYIYFANRDQSTAYPTQITDDSAWVWRETTGSVAGVDSGTVYYVNSDGFSIGFSTTAGGSNIDLLEYSDGNVTFDFPYVLDGSFNISQVKYADRQAVRYLTTGTPITNLTNNEVYYVKNLLTGLGGSSLYDFTAHTFTTGGVSGRFGPVVANVREQYVNGGATWASTYLNQGAYQGYQDWTVPEDGVYEITAAGAPGRQGLNLGGGGAIVRGRVRLFKGEIVTIAVGQRGELPPNNVTWPASSGGTFVVRKNGNIPLFVAGGGASSSNTTIGRSAVLTNTGGTSQRGYGGGVNGNGAGGINSGGAGGGFFSAGGNSSVGGGGGGFNNGLVGGFAGGSSSGNGGFGGGGGSDGQTWGGNGGAGGYGGGATNDAVGSQSGGGGGSYIFPTATDVATSDGTYNGSTLFRAATITNLGQFNTGAVEGSVSVTLVESSVYGFTLHPTAADADANTNAIPVAAAGGSYHALIPLSYDTVGNKINFVSAHGLVNGAAVNYGVTAGSGAAAGGLSQSTVYYVEKLDNFTIKLSTTPDPSFTAVDLTSPSEDSAIETLKVLTVNTSTNSFTIANHGFLVGQPVRYNNGGGLNVSVSPLQNLATYYVKEVIDNNRFTVSQSLNGPEIDILTAGTGTNHSFIYTVLNELEDSIYLPSHGYVSGQTVKYQKSRDFFITNLESSGTSRFVSTSVPHNFQVNNRITFDALQRPAVATPSIVVTQIASSGQTRTLTLAANHNMTTGQFIDVVGFTGTRDSRFNGTFIVTGVPTGNTIQYTAEESVTISTENVGETATMKRNPIAEYDENSRVLDIRTIASSGQTRTINTTKPHRFTTGYIVNIQGIPGETGNYFNGVYVITSTPTTNSFTYTGQYEDPTRVSVRNPNITIVETSSTGTAFMEMIIDSIVSSTRFRYQMPQSSFTHSLESNATGKTSVTDVRVSARQLTNRTLGQFSTQSNHGLSVGDKFTVTSITGNNNDVFNGTYTVTGVPGATTVQFLYPGNPKDIENVALSGTNAGRLNTESAHNIVAGNYFYLNNVSGDDGLYWSGVFDIASVAATGGTSRTINTTNPHGMSTNSRFRVYDIAAPGITPSDWNGDWIVSGVNSSTSFNYTAATSFTIATTNVTAGKVQRANAVSSVPVYSINNRNRTANVADVTFTANHDLIVGDRIRIENMTGADAAVFNGDFTITNVPAANRIQYQTSTSGTITATGVSGTATAMQQIRYSIPTHTRAIARRELVSNTVALFNTSFVHDLAVGSTVTTSSLSGTNTGIFTGTFVVDSVPSTTSFTVVRPQAANVTTFTVTNRNRTSNVADLTLNTTHNLQPGDTVTVSNMTGADAAVFNGTFTISAVPATNRIQYFTLTSGTINAAAVTGNITVDIVPGANISGTITLNTVPQSAKTTGTLDVSEIGSTGDTGDMRVDTEILGLENQKTYYVQRVDANTIRLSANINLTQIADITGTGIGSQQIITTSVDYENNTLTIPNHGFGLAELVEYDTQGGTAIGGLTTATPYYVIPIDGNSIKLATTANNAESGVSIDLTTATTATGVHKLKSLIRTPDGTYTISSVPNAYTFEVVANGQVPLITKTFSPRFTVDLTQSTVKIPSHGFITGTEVTYSDGGETSIGGLTDGTHYYVITVNRDYLKLAATSADAEAGVSLALTSYGAGLSHTLTSAQINGQITGSGTVTTESGSVLVSGAGTSFSKILKVGDRFRLFPPDQEVPAYFTQSGVNTGTDEITLPNHPFSTGDAVVFSPGTGGPVVSIFQISSSGTTRTITTASPHGYSSPNVVTISGLSSTSKAEFEGTFTITGVSTYTFTYTAANSLTLSTENQTSGTAKIAGVAGVAPAPLIDGYYYYIRSIPNAQTYSLSARDRTSNVITFTTSTNHNLLPGNSFTVSGISGVNPEVFNGTFTVAQVSAANQIKVISEGVNIGNAGVTGTLTPLSSNTVTIHENPADASSNSNAVDISSAGTGSALAFTKIVPAAPIVRTIAAIGSDTQITVDRPYSVAYNAVGYSYPTFVYVRPQGYSLHRPFDGGVEMSTGLGTWYGSIVRQTRKYFRYQSGKGIQTSAAVNFKPSIDIEEMRRVGVSNSISIRTRRPHGLINGLFVNIDEAETSTGALSTQFNGRFQVTVVDSFNLLVIAATTLTETRAYGYPRLHVEAWTNGAIRAGMFDFQNGMFFEFDGQKLYCVRRSSTQQIAGTCAALKGSEFVFGTNTSFTTQLSVNDTIVLRGQTYKVASILSDTRISIKPEYKGNSGNEKEFNPATVVNVADDYFNILSHGFTNDLPVVYNSIDGTPIGGLINGKTYYVVVVDSNRFRLKASPDTSQTVSISSTGAGNPHSFTPAKTGIIATLTVDTRVPQEDWSIDPCDGTGPTGYNLDLSKIQMIYMDYSWYGAGKIRFGFKTIEGQVQYVHEFTHNNNLYESYFRSGNLPARYEVTTFANPTYIPSLFHWGTSVIMDGRFDDDRAYLFTKGSQSLNIGGTTTKVFGSTAISTLADTITIPSHGFATGEAVSFNSQGTSGTSQANTQNPALEVVPSGNQNSNLTNETTYFVRKITDNLITLATTKAHAEATAVNITNYSKSGWLVTVNTASSHGFTANQSVWIYVPSSGQFTTAVSGSYRIFDTPSGTQFRYFAFVSNRDFGTITPTAGSAYVLPYMLNYTSQGNSQANYLLAPAGSLNNTSGANYQPLISLRLSPSVSEGLTGGLGDRDVINRMQLRMNEVGVQTNQLVDVKLLLNARLNNLNFVAVDSPSLVQVVEHTSNDTVSGGVQVYNFRASGDNGLEQTTAVSIDELFELSNSILGGSSVFPDGPDIMTVAVARLTGSETLASAKLSWREAQA
ncbi:ALK tyrosine kinase receptor [Actinomycetia phage DSL-LC01]|nr:ALK tyrosine kinase receptor [Actinomycetia phage DSL-LC01]